MEALDLRTEELIKKDLSTLAMREGLKNSRFVSTNLIQERILPGRHEQQPTEAASSPIHGPSE